MKLPLMYLLLLITQRSSGFICNLCEPKYIFINNTPCFEFGDCMDKGHDDNTFWISQLDAYLRTSVGHLSSKIRAVERRISPEYENGNISIFEGTPQSMCMPSEELSKNAAFIRKMHSAYRLSELARKCKTMAMDIIAQVLARLETIAEKLY
jgi:hypothetical protein